MSDKENDRSASRELRWWQRAVIYQIAPMSFQDSNGNGKGDLEGIMQRLSHLEWLGVDAVWLCPIYRSGMLDFGYDIIDYCDVDPLFGSLADFDRLLKAMHGRGIKVRPECMECLEELRAVLDEFPDRALAGEVQGKIGRIGHFYGNDRPRLHLPLNFALLETPWDALSLQGTIAAYLKAIPGHAWPDWVVGGHDKRRVASRIGPAQARILAMLLLTLRGTPFFFAGDEIGMTDVSIPPECVQDVFEQRVPGYGLNRDPERSPMRWDDSANGGFTSGSPWLPMGHGVGERNVARLQQDPRSVLWLYRSLIRLRKQEKALTAGSYVPLRSRNDVLMFKRSYGDTELLVALNFSHDPRKLPYDATADLLISTHLDRDPGAVQSSLILRGDEGVILRVSERRT